MQIQNHVRFKKRIPCEFHDESGRHVGMALNVSEGGLFVSSQTTPQVGSRVLLGLSSQDGESATGIAARVVWKRKVHRSTNQLADTGIGLEIEDGNEMYSEFLRTLVPELIDPALNTADAGLAVEADLSQPEFRVRVSFTGTPRTRFVNVRAASEADAAAGALEQLGEGWHMLEVGDAGPPLDPEDSRF